MGDISYKPTATIPAHNRLDSHLFVHTVEITGYAPPFLRDSDSISTLHSKKKGIYLISNSKASIMYFTYALPTVATATFPSPLLPSLPLLFKWLHLQAIRYCISTLCLLAHYMGL